MTGMPHVSTTWDVLVVDDDPDLSFTLQALLEDEGYRVTTAIDGAEALSLLRNAEAPPRLIVLDLLMPGMDGWQFLRARAQCAMLASVPVAVLSGAPGAASSVAGLGAVTCVAKTGSIDPLLALPALAAIYAGPTSATPANDNACTRAVGTVQQA